MAETNELLNSEESFSLQLQASERFKALRSIFVARGYAQPHDTVLQYPCGAERETARTRRSISLLEDAANGAIFNITKTKYDSGEPSIVEHYTLVWDSMGVLDQEHSRYLIGPAVQEAEEAQAEIFTVPGFSTMNRGRINDMKIEFDKVCNAIKA